MKLKLLVIVVLLVAGAGAILVSVVGLPTSTASGATYLTSAAVVGDISNDIAATGTIAASTRYGLAFGTPARPLTDSTSSATSSSTSTAASTGSSTTWPVSSVAVKVGADVKKGEALAVGDATDLKAQLTAATATRRSASIQLTIATGQLSDAEDADNTDQIRQARISVYTAETQLAQAKSDESDLKSQIALATLTAPIDGIVSEVNVVAGADAPSGDAIVIEARTYEVTADVVESDISSVTVDQPATVTIAALGGSVQGKVTAILRTSTTSSSTSVVSYPVTVGLVDPPVGMLPGMTADLTITTASVSNVLTVPSEALAGTADSYAVRILGSTGVPETRPVTVGLVTSTLAEITSGLSAGDTVITGTTAARAATTTTNNGGGFGGRFGGGGVAPGGAPGGFGN
jgi:macrolide-specific efflux system membrane fusion protein